MSSPLATGHWTQTFNDDFNTFDTKKWSTTFHDGVRTLSGNGEQQFYMDPAYKGSSNHALGVNPFSDENGVLTITAQPTDPSVKDKIWGYNYTSGVITTEHSFSQEYGYFEMRAQLPQGKGMWPAFWMLPSDKSWPPELDALEAFGATNSRHEGGANKYHVGAVSNDNGFGDWKTVPGDIYNGYHTYGVKWDPNHLTYYFDGQQIAQTATPTDMHKPMYMLANLAVGGNWAEAPTGETGKMNIDYIRAWSEDPNDHPIQTTASTPAAHTSNHAAPQSGGTDWAAMQHEIDQQYAAWQASLHGNQGGGQQTAAPAAPAAAPSGGTDWAAIQHEVDQQYAAWQAQEAAKHAADWHVA